MGDRRTAVAATSQRGVDGTLPTISRGTFASVVQPPVAVFPTEVAHNFWVAGDATGTGHVVQTDLIAAITAIVEIVVDIGFAAVRLIEIAFRPTTDAPLHITLTVHAGGLHVRWRNHRLITAPAMLDRT